MTEGGSQPELGAVWDGSGVRFALWSLHATAVELCLFAGEDGGTETERVSLSQEGEVWRVRVPGAGPGQLYGYRVHGPFEPERGHLFNPAKLLVDPRARAVSGELRASPALYGYRRDPARGVGDRLEPDPRDSAPWVPRCVVVDPAFDWGDDRPPRVPWSDTVIYECHVKGMTARHPEVPAALRGTYLGLAQPPVVEHLKRLGVTAVELLPVQQFASRPGLPERGLTNYWGYDPLAWWAPHNAYATGDRGAQVTELKEMVKALHAAGLEVILDVVFNHTVEGHERELTVSLRGIDHASYYRLRPDDSPLQEDFTGCGNTLAAHREPARELILSALRFWVEEMRVDGFRFDLATALGREEPAFQPGGELLRAIGQDPVLTGVKLIAEPWDLGPGGYQLGSFPRGWAEWNDGFRDAARSFWRGDPGRAGALAHALGGSPRFFNGRGPSASVNYVACHDGFTLTDLVSYATKHNLANGEDNRDGSDENLSANWGEEGPSGDSVVRSLRRRARRNLLATLAFARGTPMLGHGDELGRTQGGNNNAYCQDNPTTWVDWELDGERRALLELAREVLALRRRYPQLRRDRFADPQGSEKGGGEGDVRWLSPKGRSAAPEDWEGLGDGAFEMLLGVEGAGEEALLLLLNPGANPRTFHLPEAGGAGGGWRLLLSTDDRPPAPPSGGRLQVTGRSLVLLCRGSEG